MHTALIPFLDPTTLINAFGPWALLGICFIIFAETGLLVGFVLPGDTLLFFTGLLTFTGTIGVPIYFVAPAIALAAFIGGEAGYLIGRKAGPRIFERKESGFFSIKNVERTNAFFERFGGFAVVIARFVPVVRTFAPVAAGVGRMDYRKYSLYNAIGAIIWGGGFVMLGYFLGQIPVVADFTAKYIDVVLLAVVVITLVPTVLHTVMSARKSKKLASAADADAVEATGAAEELLLDPEVFNRRPGKGHAAD
ncbi:VTT domain-containing protein [Subtercola sp. PAMC28395]|uniref:DedA family protein n=1 Tax=Subtercola sp. PAMC28395 TaxID=2846775 RepID=UPI001C0B4443|nr:VTT domain-containing protein [Subtercola sp. PAMC28395]QWT25456.1 VTT domain-containing protein [Subtercola sp. PAMC28395]